MSGVEIRSSEETMILDSVDKFLERDVRPVASELEASDTYPEAIVDRMIELGLFGATISTEYGGLGLSATCLLYTSDAADE